jgi:hypothetical protein
MFQNVNVSFKVPKSTSNTEVSASKRLMFSRLGFTASRGPPR